jgi:hypothetical protein
MAVQFVGIKQPVGWGKSSLAGAKPVSNADSDVSLVQDMLNQIPASAGGRNDPSGGVPKLAVNGNIGGPMDPTVQAIRTFQQRQFGWADGVVDPDSNTERRMHRILGSQPGGDITPTAKKQDMIVLVKGFDPNNPAAGQKDPTGAAEPLINFPTADFLRQTVEDAPGYLQTHNSVIVEYWNGGGGAAKPSSDPTDAVIASIKDAVGKAVLAGGTFDRLVLLGYSIGGRNAATIAREVAAQHLPRLAYLGIADAAFDNENDAARTSPGINPRQSDNFFVKVTNELRQKFLPGLEFHGEITGCTNSSLDNDLIVKARKEEFDSAHHLQPKKDAFLYFNKQHGHAVGKGMLIARSKAIATLS